MYIPRRRKARLKMGLMIAISSLSIGALAASTMAWYSVNTSITVNSSTVSIRTALQYHFYAFNGNGFNVEGNDPEAWRSGSGYNQSDLANFSLINEVNDVPADYKEVDELAQYNNRKDDYITALTKVSGLWPGYKMSFAVRVDGLQEDDNPSLDIVKDNINPGQASGLGKDKNESRKPHGEDRCIFMAEAIIISGGSGASLSAAVSASSAKNIAFDNSGKSVMWWSKEVDALSGQSANDPRITIGDASGRNGASKWWYFFTVEFSNSSNTYYSPNSKSGTIEYYEKNSEGNSSCYEGLSFALGTMDLK